MGCVPDDPDCQASEQPRHLVSLGRGFDLMAQEVTVDQFRRFAAASSEMLVGRWLPAGNVQIEPQPKGSGPDHPVVYVDWTEAVAFCRFVGSRLPTEAEWEYAARGGRPDAIYPWGADYAVEFANAAASARDGRDQWDQTSPVNSFRPNAFGLYDMAGNVWEWTSTVHRPYPYRRDDGREDPKSSDPRVVRGGGFLHHPKYLRVSSRKEDPPHAGDSSIGFRCARDAGP
jgi:formylglycine-generating enzyme required for sulfatase activity